MSSSASSEARKLIALTEELSSLSKSFNAAPSEAGLRSRYDIMAKLGEIQKAVRSPSDMAYQQSANLFEVVAIRTLRSLGALQKIPPSGSISIEDLSGATGVTCPLLERLLRLLVATRFLEQTEDLDYCHTTSSRAYITSPGPAEFLDAVWQFPFKALAMLPEYLAARGIKDEPNDLRFNPFTWIHNQDGKTMWEILAQNPESSKTLQLGLANVEASVPILGFYNFNQLWDSNSKRAILVDVGGGMGQSISQILESYPELPPDRFVLQDLPGPIQEAKISERLHEAVVKMEHDFYTEQPIKGAKAYYLRRVLHNYSDDVCVEILKPLARAMRPDSVLLIADMVLSAKVEESNFAAYVMDVMMLFMGGKERTVETFVKILKRAGLMLVTVHRSAVGAGALVEAKLLDSN